MPSSGERGSAVKTITPSPGSAGQGCSRVSQAMRRAMPGPPSIQSTPGKASPSSSRSSGKWVQASTPTSMRSPLGGVEHRLGRGADGVDRDVLAGELRLGEIDQLGRAVADDRAVGRELGCEIVDIGLADGRLRAEHADHAGLRQLRRRLDRRNGADDRQVERRAHVVQRDGRSGVAGDHREARMEALDQPAEQGRDAAAISASLRLPYG